MFCHRKGLIKAVLKLTQWGVDVWGYPPYKRRAFVTLSLTPTNSSNIVSKTESKIRLYNCNFLVVVVTKLLIIILFYFDHVCPHVCII